MFTAPLYVALAVNSSCKFVNICMTIFEICTPLLSYYKEKTKFPKRHNVGSVNFFCVNLLNLIFMNLYNYFKDLYLNSFPILSMKSNFQCSQPKKING